MAKPKKRKYDRKFAMQLKRGIRKNGMSIPEVCAKWGITIGTYKDWVEDIAEFARAHDQGISDSAAWWFDLYRKAASGEVRGNASLIMFAMKNVDGIGWKDKSEITREDEKIQKITINVLPSPATKIEKKSETRVIEQIPEEGEIIEG